MKVKFFVGCLSFFLVLSLQADLNDYAKGISYCDAKEYEKAFPIVLKEAQNDNKAAQYRLAYMYEYGRGVKEDKTKALYWYKRSSSSYAYVIKNHDINNSEFLGIDEQLQSDSFKRGNEFSLAKLDTSTPETKKLVTSLLSGGFFGLKPYDVNFFLPLSYGKDKPIRQTSAYHLDDPNLPLSASQLRYNNNTEAEFQLSLRKQVSYDLFGFNEYIYFAYTQKVWWQIYSDSAPFRETNYLPEVYLAIPSSASLDDKYGIKALKLGFLHESNGQEGYRSRSWNRLYITGMLQWGNWFMGSRVWYRLPEDDKPAGYYEGQLGPAFANAAGDDNPDIENYLGYGDINIDYLNGNSQYSLMIRNNLRFNSENKGALEFNWSYAVFSSPNTFLYVKLFHGYGESLISYDSEVTKIAAGFSFSRGLF